MSKETYILSAKVLDGLWHDWCEKTNLFEEHPRLRGRSFHNISNLLTFVRKFEIYLKGMGIKIQYKNDGTRRAIASSSERATYFTLMYSE